MRLTRFSFAFLLILPLALWAQPANDPWAGRLEAAQKLETQHPNQALSSYRALSIEFPQAAPVAEAHTACLLRQNQAQAAWDLISPFLNQKNASALAFRLGIHARQGLDQWDEAIALAQTGLKKHPEDPGLHTLLGEMRAKEMEKNAAILELEKAVALSPDHPKAYYTLALLFLESDRPWWGMLYGEYFVLLTGTGEKASRISTELFHAYQSEIKADQESLISSSFKSPPKKTKGKPNENAQAYQLSMLASVDSCHQVPCKPQELFFGELACISTLRTCLLRQAPHGVSPFPLVAFWEEADRASLWDVYNFWLFGAGAPEAVLNYLNLNPAAFDQFGKWLDAHAESLLTTPFLRKNWDPFYGTPLQFHQ